MHAISAPSPIFPGLGPVVPAISGRFVAAPQ